MKTFTLRMNGVASVLRRVLGGAFCAQTWSVISLGLILLLGPSGARADIIDNYVFAPGASTVLGGDTLTISGSYTRTPPIPVVAWNVSKQTMEIFHLRLSLQTFWVYPRRATGCRLAKSRPRSP
jgi:hypothetical protein